METMLKNIVQFKSVIQGIESAFHFDSNCPASVAKEALFECLKWVGKIEDDAKAKMQAEAPPDQIEKDEEKS